MNKQVHQPDDKWLEALRHKMDEAHVSPPADGWARLESALDTSKRGVVLWPWLIPSAVAAMAILTFLWDGTNPSQNIELIVDGTEVVLVDTIPVDTVSVGSGVQQAVAMSSVKEESTSLTHSGSYVAYTSHKKESTSELSKKDNSVKYAKTKSVHVASMSSNDTKDKKEGAAANSSIEQGEKASTSSKRPVRRYTNISWGEKTTKRTRTYKLSLLASSGMMNNQNTAGTKDNLGFAVMDISEGEGKLYAYPENALLYRAIPEYKYDHDLPVKVGVGVTVSFAERWAFETGLNYTRLRSQLTDVRDDEKLTQTIHYLGVPVRLNYTWLLRSTYTCYTAFGATIERAVDARLDGEDLDVHGVQCSLEGALGVQYKLSRRWGLFGEVGVSHYFDDDSKVETYRDEHKTSLLLNFGLRFDF